MDAHTDIIAGVREYARARVSRQAKVTTRTDPPDIGSPAMAGWDRC